MAIYGEHAGGDGQGNGRTDARLITVGGGGNYPRVETPASLRETTKSLEVHTERLAQLIIQHCHSTGERFSKLALIGRGGLIPGTQLAYRLGFQADQLLHAGVRSYEADEDGHRQGDLRTGQMPNPLEVKEESVLVFDEVCDSGDTLKFVTKEFTFNGADLVRSAVLHQKVPAAEQLVLDPAMAGEPRFQPDFVACQVSLDTWVEYPWEQWESGQPRPEVVQPEF